MGIFGAQTRNAIAAGTSFPEEEEEMEMLPSPAPQPKTVVAKGIIFVGDLKGKGVVQVEGEVDGELELDGAVTVATGGMVKGPISATVVRVAGEVEGNITAKDHLRLEKTGEIRGDVSTSSLVVEDGGILNGHSSVVKAPAEPIPADLSDRFPPDTLQFGSNYRGDSED